ncbi:ABC transporter substrate-binding protein [Leifsonia sp. A12D58]|uniref:iron-siderophore ABC transporter substrate-binding protein n=1 Tax=Leifsonia sp. A12D58 TaxID=3397674 RepID=UPI0039E1EE4B
MHTALARSLRRTPVVASVLAGALALSACASTTNVSSSSPSDFETVTITHALGTAVITEQPERIVTLGMGSAETAIALGSIPVGIEEYTWGSDDTGYLPWIYDEVTEQGAELPTQFTGGTELDIEAIVELAPDLILAPWSGVTQEQYDVLADIAPTVAYEEKPWTITWEEQMNVIGTALGKSAETATLIDDIKTQFTETTAAHPEFTDVTFSFIYNTGPGTLGVFLADEQRVAMVRALGLQVDPVVDTLDETEGTDSSVIGLENADLLKGSDLLFTFYSDADNRSEIESQELYQNIPAIARGSIVAPTDQPFVTGSSIINPLTVPWALERYVPLINTAIATLAK